MCLILLFATHFLLHLFLLLKVLQPKCCSINLTSESFINQQHMFAQVSGELFILLKYGLRTHPSTLTYNISPAGVKQPHFMNSHVRSKKTFLYNCYCLLILKQQKEEKLLLSASVIFMKQEIILSGIHTTRLHFIMK